jgi:CHC2 zinc finger/Toprim-like
MAQHLDILGMLSAAGVQGLRDGKREIEALCPNPLHQDKHPSWSINKTTGLHHCFACGYKGTLTGLLVELTGAAPSDLENTLRAEGFLRQMQRVRADPDAVIEPILPYLNDWALMNELIDVPQRMLDFKRLVREAVDAYQVRWNPDTRVWVLPLRAPSTGELLGAQLKKVGTVLTLPAGLPKSTTLFGYQQAYPHDYAVLVESPLDAVRLFGLGIPAIASLGAWVSTEQVNLMARAFACVYVALDNDKQGHEGAVQCTAMLRKRRCAAIPWRYDGLVDEDGKPAKDPGDVASDDALVDAWARTQRWGL